MPSQGGAVSKKVCNEGHRHKEGLRQMMNAKLHLEPGKSTPESLLARPLPPCPAGLSYDWDHEGISYSNHTRRLSVSRQHSQYWY